MARVPLAKNPGIIADFSAKEGKLVKAAIYPVKADLTIDKSNNQGIFLINPTSIEEGKTVNWASNSIPGQSDPIFQWVSGGARTLNFEALITLDTSQRLSKSQNPLGQLSNNAINAVGSIASQFLGTSLPPLSGLLATPAEISNNPLDISRTLDYYRSLEYPTYTNNKLTSSPPLLALFMANSISGSGIAPLGNSIDNKTIVWMLTGLNIKITKFLPSLAPMEALVSFHLTQYTTAPFSAEVIY